MSTSQRLIRFGMGAAVVTAGVFSANEAFESSFEADEARSCQVAYDNGDNTDGCPPETQLDAIISKESGETWYFGAGAGIAAVVGGLTVFSSMYVEDVTKKDTDPKQTVKN